MIPAVSVIMSIYQEPISWIEKSVNSILNQSFENFEFIIINDFPRRVENDKLIKQLLKIDSRIVYLKNNKNIGLTLSLNKGLKIAKGKYIARMDADDISYSERFKVQYNYMEKNSDCVLLGTCMEVINSDEKIMGFLDYPSSHVEISQTMLLTNSLAHPTFFYRKSIIDKFKIDYSINFPYAEDYDFGCKMLMIGKVHNLSQRLVKYRKSSQQIGQSKINIQKETANRIRKINRDQLLDFKFNTCVSEEDSVTNILWELNEKNPNNIYIKNMFLSSAFYLKETNLLDRFKAQFFFSLSLKQRLRLLLYI